MKEKILVSACLLGVSSRYDGESKVNNEVLEFLKDYEPIPICPEIMGGLPTPRPPVEILNGKVLTKDKHDVTANFKRGAEETLNLAKRLNVKKALLKAKSPSCGSNLIYDGTHTKTLIEGNGITASLLKENGFEVITENDI